MAAQAHVAVDISAISAQYSQSKKQIHKVLPQLRLMVTQQSYPSVYDPVFVSLGPYHHGKPELHQAEGFKHLCLDWYTEGNEDTKKALKEDTLRMIDRIRSCYSEASVVVKYNNEALASMMLLDASFIMNFMEFCACSEDKRGVFRERFNCMGLRASLTMTARDIYVLENQIPFFVLRLLIDRSYGRDGQDFLQRFFNFSISKDLKKVIVPKEYVDEPIHLLDAYRRVSIGELTTPPPSIQPTYPTLEPDVDHHNVPSSLWPGCLTFSKRIHGSAFRSVMDLKTKGIIFRPGPSESFQDVKFKSHALYGELYFPVGKVSSKSLVNLSNMIAFEMSPNGPTTPVVSSYVVLMKSLIHTSADVKELQEQGVFRINRFANPEDVVQMFKNIDTLGLDNQVQVHKEVMQRVGEHCDNKAKTLMAELIQSKLSSPWTIIALLAATLVIILTIMQVHYARLAVD